MRQGKNWLELGVLTKNICQAIVASIVITLLVLANARVGDIIGCLNSISFSGPFRLTESHECQTTFLDSEKREELVICTTPTTNITFSVGQSELITFKDDEADRFVDCFRSCILKAKTCIKSRMIRPSSPYCVYNSSLINGVTICFNSVKDPKELRLNDYLFTENQIGLIMKALTLAYKTRV